MELAEIKRIIEALLFSSSDPLSLDRIKEVLEEVKPSQIKELIDELNAEYEQTSRSFMIIEIAGGFQTCTRPEYAIWLKRLYKRRRGQKLSMPALETLAIVGYRQPVTKGEIEFIRGVNVDGVLRTLLERELIKVKGRREGIGRPIIYVTTKRFLEYFGLVSLSGLPKLEEVETAGDKVKMNLNPEETEQNLAEKTEQEPEEELKNELEGTTR